jgi:hypothetical protein
MAGKKTEDGGVYRFLTAHYKIEVGTEFHDRLIRSDFRFLERGRGEHFCLSGAGEKDERCVTGFTGSLAIAHYRVEALSGIAGVSALREYVRTIDQDERQPRRLPFDRTIQLQQGHASDIQVFGFTDGAATKNEPWYLFRQDLFIEDQRTPALILHWKHSLEAIRILDIIPGQQTRVLV